MIADSHVAPGDDLARFHWLRNMIEAERPGFIIHLGDFGHLDSLCRHQEPGSQADIDRPSLKEDLEVMAEATEIMFSFSRGRGKGRYKPCTVLLQGNHEHRFSRLKTEDPKGLGSVVDFDQLALQTRRPWDAVVPFKGYFQLQHIQYTHVPHNKLGRPITGVHACRTIAAQAARHTVFGHTHSMQYCSVPLLGNNNDVRCALNAPMFAPKNRVEAYAAGHQTGWVYGVLRIRNPDWEGEPFDWDFVSMDTLERLYS